MRFIDAHVDDCGIDGVETRGEGASFLRCNRTQSDIAVLMLRAQSISYRRRGVRTAALRFTK
jgi:hypothetical protein